MSVTMEPDYETGGVMFMVDGEPHPIPRESAQMIARDMAVTAPETAAILRRCLAVTTPEALAARAYLIAEHEEWRESNPLSVERDWATGGLILNVPQRGSDDEVSIKKFSIERELAEHLGEEMPGEAGEAIRAMLGDTGVQ